MAVRYTELIDGLTNDESTFCLDGLAGSVLRSLQKQVTALRNLEEKLVVKAPDVVKSAARGWFVGFWS
ncbi:hypothetical protein BDV19DRAFT_361411 [Aspergillus venezuelensis]